MNIGIAGSGLAGRVLALSALMRGWQVTLFDKDTVAGTGSCGWTAAGMLAPFAEVETATSLLFDLGMQSLTQWPALLKHMQAESLLQQQGSILLAHGREQNELHHFVGLLKHKLQQDTVANKLDRNQLMSLEPELDNFAQAYYFKQEAHLDTEQFFKLSTNFLQQNCTWHERSPITALHANTLVTEQQSHHFDWVFDCRGLGAQVSISSLRGVRGELIWLHAPDVQLSRPVRMLHPRYRIYIVPMPNQQYVIGASEIESEDYSEISVRTSLELLSAAYSVHPGFAEARIVKTKVNCRPALPDNLPLVETHPRITRINGLYRHGYLLAPAVIDSALNEVLEICPTGT